VIFALANQLIFIVGKQIDIMIEDSPCVSASN